MADNSILSDDEYRAYLDALARKYVRVYRLGRHHMEGWGYLHHEIESAISLTRLLTVTAEREDDKRLLSALGDALQHAYLNWLVRSLDDSGVLRAIDEDPVTVFANLRPSVIPAEDRALLHDAGIRDADAEITLTIQYSRRHLTTSHQNVSPTEAVRQVPEQVERAGKELSRMAEVDDTSENPSATRRKRKILNGTGKILSGSIVGAGNLLLGLGGLAAPNPGVGFAIIGSCALAVGSICQGMGDLRDE